jgi:hypothetical protein
MDNKKMENDILLIVLENKEMENKNGKQTKTALSFYK